MQLKDQHHREQFSKKFVREGEILKSVLSKLPTKTTSITNNVSVFCKFN